MSSVHIGKSRERSRRQGGAAGHVSRDLWDLPKRSILEVALHLSALCTDSYDATMQDGDKGEARFREELRNLRQQGIV